MLDDLLFSSSLPMPPVIRAMIFVVKQLLIPLLREHGSPLISRAWRKVKRFCGQHLPSWRRNLLPTFADATPTATGLLNCLPESSLPTTDRASDSIISLEEVPLVESTDPDYCVV